MSEIKCNGNTKTLKKELEYYIKLNELKEALEMNASRSNAYKYPSKIRQN